MASPLADFNHGISSGDPYADSVILWTRITPENPSDPIEVSWEASTSTTFNAASIVDSGVFTTNAQRDWTVKVEAEGLSPDTTYYYRFQVGDQLSAV
ncbi:MAG: alkaline phosphatase, partial [Synechococcaceae bacterium WB9_4xB_025]|nr:alkaline phosphatase [Synechococcaceae bacterium WB9_4xB_025]